MDSNHITTLDKLEVGKFYVPIGHHYAFQYSGIDHRGSARVRTIDGISSELNDRFLPAVPATDEQVDDFTRSQAAREKTLCDYYSEKSRTGDYSGD